MPSLAPVSSPVIADLAAQPSARTAAAEPLSAQTREGAGRVQLGKRARIAALTLVLALGGGGYWYTTRGIESTDNAQIDADVIAVPARIGGIVATRPLRREPDASRSARCWPSSTTRRSRAAGAGRGPAGRRAGRARRPPRPTPS